MINIDCFMIDKYHCDLFVVYCIGDSYLHIIENVSPPKRFANHLFLTTANFKVSHLNFAFRFVCKARAIPSMITKSTLCSFIAAFNSKIEKEKIEKKKTL